MHGRQFSRLGQNPWTNGWRLALLNAGLAAFCIISFMGILFAVELLSNWRMVANGGDPSAEIPFPYLLLLALYALIYLLAWLWFGRRLSGTQPERRLTALVGVSPLLALSLLGYTAAAVILILNIFGIFIMPVGSIFAFGFMATLILFASLTCIVLLWWRADNGEAFAEYSLTPPSHE